MRIRCYSFLNGSMATPLSYYPSICVHVKWNRVYFSKGRQRVSRFSRVSHQMVISQWCMLALDTNLIILRATCLYNLFPTMQMFGSIAVLSSVYWYFTICSKETNQKISITKTTQSKKESWLWLVSESLRRAHASEGDVIICNRWSSTGRSSLCGYPSSLSWAHRSTSSVQWRSLAIEIGVVYKIINYITMNIIYFTI